MPLAARLATLLLLALPSAARAQTKWLSFQSDSGLQYDASRVKKSGSTVTLWVKAEFSPPRRDQGTGHDIDKLVANDMIDCGTKRYKTLALVQYDNGEVISSFNPPLEDYMIQLMPWKDPVPDSLAEEVVIAVCRTWG